MNSDELPEVDLDRCFGCAACLTGCPEHAIVMESEPGFPEPPKDGKALRDAVIAASN
jgi:Fe-S-cluster-containing hydrogenase component 2